MSRRSGSSMLGFLDEPTIQREKRRVVLFSFDFRLNVFVRTYVHLLLADLRGGC